jgi:hypothetical protein
MVAGSRFTHQPDVPITQAPGGEAPALAQK